MLLMRAMIDGHSNPHRTRHRHASHELLVMERGRGSQLTVRGEERCVPGEIFVFPEGQPHMSYAAAHESFACLVVQADPGDLADGTGGDGGGGLFALLAEQATADNRLRVRPATRARVRGLMTRALGEWKSPLAGARCAARALVMEALVALVRDPALVAAHHTPSTSPTEQHVEAAQRWIDQYWMQPIRIADLVALGALERSQFLAGFRACTGTTVGDALLATRLREAKRLLAEPGTSMLDIALGCGFGSQSHFNHRFRKALGCSPRAWRETQQA